MASFLFRSTQFQTHYPLKRIEQLFLYFNRKKYCTTPPDVQPVKDATLANVNKSYVSRRSWSDQDTEKLIRLVGKYGNKWTVFTSYFSGRTSFCIRSHYFSVKHDTTRWTLEEKKILQRLLGGEKDFDRIDWENIQKSLPKTRTISRIQQFYQNSIQPSINKGSWTKEESEQLMELTEVHGKDWTTIAKKIGTRSEEQCRNKYAYEVSTLKKGEFSKEEDEAIIDGVKKYGINEFQKIKEEMGSKRSVSQLRTRYNNFLDPEIDKSAWTKEEKETLFKLYSELNNLKQVKLKMNSKRSIRDMYNQLRSAR